MKILQYCIFIIIGAFLEFWVYTISHIFSIKDILFNQEIAWGRFALLMTIGNLILVGVIYILSKLAKRLFKLKTYLLLTIILIWVVGIIVTSFYYY